MKRLIIDVIRDLTTTGSLGVLYCYALYPMHCSAFSLSMLTYRHIPFDSYLTYYIITLGIPDRCWASLLSVRNG